MAKQGKSTGRRSKKSKTSEGVSTHLLERLDGMIQELASLRYEEDQERFDDIVAELVNFGELLKERLVAMSTSISYQERRAAVEAVGRLDFSEREAILVRRLGDANWKVRRSAALAVTQRPFEQAFESLVLLADDSHRGVMQTPTIN